MTSAVPEPEEEDENKSSWEDLLRKMLPLGAPLPDEEHLDYSIAIEYNGPPIPHKIPKIEPVDNNSASSSIVPRFRRDRDESDYTTFSRKPHVVTFNSPPHSHAQSDDDDDRDDDVDEDDVRSNASPRESGFDSPVVDLKNGERKWPWKKKNGGDRVCFRCGNKSRLKEREACIVCDAKYCNICLLKAMGSMPEGRKCVKCIGKSIDELKRSNLGKCSRMLSKVCSELEVKQIMKAEKECFANQLRPEQVVVNGRQLRQDELDEVLGCLMPPENLKPGNFWYDKDSGLWGKEGEKPDKIVSSKLNIGGKLGPDASNGNTKVFINGREITKIELRVLKLAKVQCPRDTHFWVYDDGSYEEEGQNNIKGNIWGKTFTRFISSLFSLPVPCGNPHDKNGDASTYSGMHIPVYPEDGRLQKLLLVGLEGSGTCTIFKQAKFLHGDKFSPEEVQNIKVMIQSNLYRYLSALLEGRERLEEAMKEKKSTVLDTEESLSGESETDDQQCIYSINQRHKHFSDWLLGIVAMGELDAYFPAAAREYALLVDEIWKGPAIQETYKRREELHLVPDVAKYFLDRAVEIASNEYEPSEKDILYAEGITHSNGLTFFNFSFDDRSPMSEIYNENFECAPPQLTRYQLIRLNSKGLHDGCKWLEMFEDTSAVIFCVALSDYDQMSTQRNCPPQNKMLAIKDLFESLVSRPSFSNTPFILLLNKYDVFEEKIGKVPLTVCEWFNDFNPVKPHNNVQALAQHAYYYVAVKFKEVYASISGQKLFVFQSRARERNSIDEAFKYIREVLIWNEGKAYNTYGGNGDDSFFSTEMSSSHVERE